MNVLIINGHIRWARVSSGRLNRKINHMAANVAMQCGYNLKYSEADRFYSPLTEVEKFLWADRIIIHFPVNWFGLPGKFKAYIDTVLMSGENELYQGDGRKHGGAYGSGGLLNGKSYFLVATWSAPPDSFNDSYSFFEGTKPDGVLFGVHKIFQFMGMQCEGAYHFLDVYENKNLTDDFNRFHTEITDFVKVRDYVYNNR